MRIDLLNEVEKEVALELDNHLTAKYESVAEFVSQATKEKLQQVRAFRPRTLGKVKAIG
jgi:hypothetical protein